MLMPGCLGVFIAAHAARVRATLCVCDVSDAKTCGSNVSGSPTHDTIHTQPRDGYIVHARTKHRSAYVQHYGPSPAQLPPLHHQHPTTRHITAPAYRTGWMEGAMGVTGVCCS